MTGENEYNGRFCTNSMASDFHDGIYTPQNGKIVSEFGSGNNWLIFENGDYQHVLWIGKWFHPGCEEFNSSNYTTCEHIRKVEKMIEEQKSMHE